jgi:very-short-patch-repair endonuclease
MKHQRFGQMMRARGLRADATDAERKLWRHIRDRQLEGVKFRRQHPIGSFVADFCCLELGLIIELDGSQHANRTEEDDRRTEYLRQQGFEVFRFWNPDVLNDVESIVETIRVEILAKPPHPGPLPACGERE